MESYALFVRNPELQPTLSTFGNEPGKRVLVIGDSHAKDMFNALYLYRDTYRGKFSLRHLNYAPGCIYKFTEAGPQGQECDLAKSGDRLFREADFILVSARWDENETKGIGAFINYYQREGKRMVITGRIVEFPNAPVLMHRLYWDNQRILPDTQTINQTFWDSKTPGIDEINRHLHSIADAHHAIYLDKWAYACDATRHQCFALDDAGKPLHYDYGHTTVEGARFMGQRIVEIDWLGPLRR
jgi:hypothetical protein